MSILIIALYTYEHIAQHAVLLTDPRFRSDGECYIRCCLLHINFHSTPLQPRITCHGHGVPLHPPAAFDAHTRQAISPARTHATHGHGQPHQAPRVSFVRSRCAARMRVVSLLAAWSGSTAAAQPYYAVMPNIITPPSKLS